MNMWDFVGATHLKFLESRGISLLPSYIILFSGYIILAIFSRSTETLIEKKLAIEDNVDVRNSAKINQSYSPTWQEQHQQHYRGPYMRPPTPRLGIHYR